MNARLFVGWLFVLLVAMADIRAADRPNLLWITAEDLSPRLGCFGDTFARTPNLDAFAKQAVRYTRAFSAAPVCAPSRVTLVTGVWANSLGNPHLRCEMTLPDGFEGYPVYLRNGGYFTTNNVKTDYNLRDEAAIVRRWWNRSNAQAHWRQRAPGQPFMAVFNLMETHQSRLSVWPESQFEREIGSQLTATERANPAKVPVPSFYPDLPATRKAMARLYDCITVMDRRVGELLRQLEDDGLAEDTIVFYYADHGTGMPRSKRLLYDSGTHVPLMIRFPKKWAHLAPAAPGASVDRLVTFVDFAPTLLSLAGLPIPAHFQGTAFAGEAAGAPRQYVFATRDRVDEAYDTARSARDERWLYIRNYRPHLSWAPPEGYSNGSPFRRELVALARAGKLGTGPTAWLAPTRAREELYDTVADPDQLRNLATDAAYSTTLHRLRSALRDWLGEIRDAAFLPEEQSFARAQGQAPYTLARTAGAYPFERILATAEWVGDNAAVAHQRKALRDSDPTVRYWATVGFAANVAGAGVARVDLEQALRDESPSVRVEAAGALLGIADHPAALELLSGALRGNDLNVALHAARTLQYAGDRARPVLPQIRERLTLARTRQDSSPPDLYLVFSLEALTEALDSPRTK